MTYTSRFDEITQAASLRAQKAVEIAGQEIEFEARARAAKNTGDMAAGIQWRPDKTGKPEGRVVGSDFKTHFYEFGSARQAAQPMLVPAAEQARPGFLQDMSRIYK